MTATVVLATSGLSSPLNNKLLSLVPPGSEIVAGFENHPPGNKPGRLILATHNDGLDLEDWQALAGVDGKRIVNVVIEVAASSTAGKLTEHLLLVEGRFDKERIFNSAQLNGAETTEYEDQTVILIKPFAREQREMLDSRWLVILNGRIAVFGTQLMVQKALHRYATHADIDMPLMERLTQLRPDVTSWNVLVVSPAVEGNVMVTQKHSLFTPLIDNAEVLLLGSRFGSRIRVDFSVHARGDRETASLADKAASFTEAFVSRKTSQSTSLLSPRRRLGNLSVEQNRVYGSIELSEREFQEWCQKGQE